MANALHDLDSGFLTKLFKENGLPFHRHDLPEGAESELKLILPPEKIPAAHAALNKRGDITFASPRLISKGKFLVNIGLDTYDKRNEENCRLFQKSGYQARFRFSVVPASQGYEIKYSEFNIKSKINRHANGHRREYEAHAKSFAKAFRRMARLPEVQADKDLNFERFDPDRIFATTAAITSRVHGEFGHWLSKKGPVIQQLDSVDHTIYTGPFFDPAPGRNGESIAEDWEIEVEARGIYTLGKKQHLQDKDKKTLVQSSHDRLQRQLVAVDPETIWPAHRSKMGRSVKRFTRGLGLGNDESAAIDGALQNKITIDNILGRTKHPAFKKFDFRCALVNIIVRYSLPGDAIIKDFINFVSLHEPA